MAEVALPQAARPPFWRNVRVLRVLGQVVFVLVVIEVFREIGLNLSYGLRQIGLDLSFGFLDSRAGFGIKEGIEYSPNHSFLKAYAVGVVNTIRVAGIGIVLAMLLGLVMGVARLSPNWLVRKVAQVYVEAIRNTPVLIQVIFLWLAVILTLPVIEGGLSLGNFAFLSNRGGAIPWVHAGKGLGAWVAFLALGLAAAAGVWIWRTRVNERTGEPHHRVLWSGGLFLLVAAAGYVVAQDPLRLDVPTAGRRGYEGGLQLSPEYAAILLALVIYTGAFIAEIVRGSILAVSKGQKEAAAALGFRPGQQLRLIVLPQAMRVAIPPLNSQFLNLTKNSSLAIAIGYPDLMAISRTIMNQAGRAAQMLVIVMLTYLSMSLFISLLMNLLNRTVTRSELR